MLSVLPVMSGAKLQELRKIGRYVKKLGDSLPDLLPATDADL